MDICKHPFGKVSIHHITSWLSVITHEMCFNLLLHPCGLGQRTKDLNFEESSGDVCNALIFLTSNKALSNRTLQHKFFLVCFDK